MIKKVFTVLLLILALGFLTMPIYAATDIWNVGSYKIDSTGALIPASTASQQVLYEKATTQDTLVTADSGKVIVYEPTTPGTAGTFTLPAAAVGLKFTIVAGSASDINVDPDGTDVIRFSTCVAGDKISSNAATADSVTLVSYEANKWAVESLYGTWADAN